MKKKQHKLLEVEEPVSVESGDLAAFTTALQVNLQIIDAHSSEYGMSITEFCQRVIHHLSDIHNQHSKGKKERR